MVILQAASPLTPLKQQWLSPPPSDQVLPLFLTPQEEGVVIQDYSAVSVSEQLWVRPAGSQLRVGTCVVQSQLCVDAVLGCLLLLNLLGATL